MAGLGAAPFPPDARTKLVHGTKLESRERRAVYSLTFLHRGYSESWQAQGLEGDMHNLMLTESLNRIR